MKEKGFMTDAQFEQWLNDNARLVRSLAANYRINTMTRDEVVQDLNIACWHAMLQFDPELGVQFSTYAFSAMKNRAKELYRMETTKKRLFEQEAESLDGVTPEGIPLSEIRRVAYSESTDELLVKIEIHNVIESVLNSLSKRDAAIVQYVMEGYSQKYVAHRFNLTQPCISTIYANFKRRVRAALEEAGLD